MKKLLLMLTIMLSMTLAGSLYAAEAVLNVNTATVEQLQAVKGVGPKTAKAIVEYRTAHGNFTAIEGLTAVKGIGAKKLAKIRTSLTVKTAKAN